MEASAERRRCPACGRGRFTDVIYEEPEPGGSEPVCPPTAAQVTREDVEPTNERGALMHLETPDPPVPGPVPTPDPQPPVPDPQPPIPDPQPQPAPPPDSEPPIRA